MKPARPARHATLAALFGAACLAGSMTISTVWAQPAPRPKPGTPPAAPATPAPAPKPGGPEVDEAYGAYQRGYYLTAFAVATRRARDNNDAKAMTLLGELYADGLGVGRSDKQAENWYKLAADRGDRNAMFALAMFRFQARNGPADREAAAKWFASAAKLGHAPSAYNLGLLYLEGQQFPQDYKRAAELFRSAANAGNTEAQYALATLYKEGRGVPKDVNEAAKLLGAATLADNLDALVEYAIMTFNGEGVPKNEAAAAALFLKGARRGSPIAQNRLARILSAGRGMKEDPVEALKWHLAAKAGGAGDTFLDTFAGKLTAQQRAAAEKAAKPWIDAVKAQRS
jgi:hypothetical protein